MLFEAHDLSISLLTRTGVVYAVDGVSFALDRGETMAVVGESGSGKTVMTLAPFGLMPPGVGIETSGSLRLDGREGLGTNRDALLPEMLGSKVGVIFQDPLSALNPARTVGRQIAEVAEKQRGLTARAAETRALEIVKLVGLTEPRRRLRQYPHELSGGMRQRVMIAIAIVAEPVLLIADEATTALDVTIQAQILDTLRSLQRRLGMAIILITHDIGVVAGMADQVLVLYAGRLAEFGPADAVLTAPQHPYTRALLASLPDPGERVGAAFRGLPGVPPDLRQHIDGCAFAPRCGHAQPRCRTSRIPVRAQGAGRSVACVLDGDKAVPA